MAVDSKTARACDLRLAACAGWDCRTQWLGCDAPRAASRKSQARVRGAVLLEVLIALALLIFGLAVVGMQVNKGLDAARVADIGTKGVMLAETKMAELNSGVIKPEDNNDEIKGDFGMVYPGYTWRFKFQPTEVNDFLAVELNIGFSGKQAKEQLDNPDQQIDFDESDVRVVESIYRLVPIPADVNFERDFGVTQEEMQNAQAQADQEAAGGGAGGGGGAQGGGMDMSQLLQLLGPLLAGGSFDPRMIANLPAEQIAQFQPFLQALLGNGKMDAKGPLDSIFQGGGRGRFGRGPRGGRDGNGPPGDNARNPNGGENNGNSSDNNNGNDTSRTRTRRNPNDSGQGNNSNTSGNNSGNDNGNGNTGNETRRGRTRNQNNSGNSNDSGSNTNSNNGNNNSNRNGNQGGSSNRRSGRNQGNNSNQSR